MVVLAYESGQLRACGSFREALRLEGEKAPVLAVVGAGGKTSTVFRLAEEYRNAGIPVIITTTTHMQIEGKSCELLRESMEELGDLLKREGMAQVGIEDTASVQKGVRKMKAVSEHFFREICSLGFPVLVEADGAKRLPCKVPETWEPVIPPEATGVVAVYGLDAVGKRIGDVCFRAEKAAKLLKKEVADRLEPEDVALFAGHVQGGRKGVGRLPYQVLLNKADDAERTETALEICRRLEAAGFCHVTVTSDRRKERAVLKEMTGGRTE